MLCAHDAEMQLYMFDGDLTHLLDKVGVDHSKSFCLASVCLQWRREALLHALREPGKTCLLRFTNIGQPGVQVWIVLQYIGIAGPGKQS